MLSGQKKALLQLINEARREANLPEFTPNDILQEMAEDHAKNNHQYGGTHSWWDKEEEEFVNMYWFVVKGMYDWPGGWNEDVLRGVNQGYKAFWMLERSPGHWAVLMHPSYNLIGIGKAAKEWCIDVGSLPS